MKKLLLYLSLVFTSLFALEIMLRFYGYTPFKYFDYKVNSIHEYNEVLGWKPKKGNYTFKSKDDPEKFNKVTIMKQGNRFSGNNKESLGGIYLLGGSFVFGEGVSDNETFAYHLNILNPKYNVYNFSVPGYGTVQSLLMLKEIKNELKLPEIIIYGFINHHKVRNVARGEWLNHLLQNSSKDSKFKPKVPYGVINKDSNLYFHSPIGYIMLPLREKLALVAVLEKIYMKQITKNRKKQQHQVFHKSIYEMKKVADTMNSKFVVVNIDLNKSESDKKLTDYLKNKDISYVDCRVPNFQKFKIKGDYHPNKLGHNFYSECIVNFLIKNNLK